MAKQAAVWGRVGGVFHSDELPAYGIEASQAQAIAKRLGCREADACVAIADQEENVRDGLRAVVERARESSQSVPEETRAADPDGTTHYMRPRPGAARMYPETDVPPVSVSAERIQRTFVRHLRSETRAADPDGTPHYMRPRPGAARMYPETDVPPVSVSAERIQGTFVRHL